MAENNYLAFNQNGNNNGNTAMVVPINTNAGTCWILNTGFMNPTMCVMSQGAGVQAMKTTPLNHFNGKTKESDTNVYINRTALVDALNSNDDMLTNEIKKVYDECVCAVLCSPPSNPEFPKITFPRKEGIQKKSYLFVDFVLEDVDMGKMASREFIKQFNQRFGHNVAQCAKEKDQESNNLYFEPLPRGTTKETLENVIVKCLDRVGVDPSSWSIYVKENEKGNYPVGFCRVDNDTKTVDEIIRRMNRHTWKEVGFPNNEKNPTTKLVVKRANRSSSNDLRPMSAHTLTATPVQCFPANNVQFMQQMSNQQMSNQAQVLTQPQMPMMSQQSTIQSSPMMSSQEYPIKYEPTFSFNENYQPSYNMNQIWSGSRDIGMSGLRTPLGPLSPMTSEPRSPMGHSSNMTHHQW